jgi:AcrR family transcriptional regulator
MTTTMEQLLAEMQERVTRHPLTGTADNRELTEIRQQQIVEAASRVLFEKGFHRTSIRDIAAACGMSMGQLYHYISSKDDLLYLIHSHSQQLWYERVRDADIERLADPVARLAFCLRLSLEFVYEHRQLFLFLYTETKYLDPQLLKLVLDRDDKNVVGFYRRLLADIPALGIGADDREVAANLVEFISVFMALRLWNLDRTRVPETMDFLVEFMLRGLGLAAPQPT